MTTTTGTPANPPPFAHEQVDSTFRVNGTTSDFTWQCKNIQKDMPVNIAWNRCCVEDIAVPKSYYLVQAPYNCFTLQEGANSVTVTVTPGNYKRKNFASNLATLLNAASPGHFTYTVTYPRNTQPDTGLYTYTVTNNGGVQPSFIFPSTQPCTVHRQMGFDPKSINAFVNNVLTSANFVDFQLDWYLNLTSDLCETDGNNILISVNMAGINNADVANDITVHPIFGKRFDMTKFSGKVRFSLVSTDGLAINLNGLPIKFNLKFWRAEATTGAPPPYSADSKNLLGQQQFGLPPAAFNILDPSITNPGILAAYGQTSITDPDGILVDYPTLASGMLTAPENQVPEQQPVTQPVTQQPQPAPAPKQS